jgi:hypothetical protein
MEEEKVSSFNIHSILDKIRPMVKESILPRWWLILAVSLLFGSVAYYKISQNEILYSSIVSFILEEEDIASESSSGAAFSSPILMNFMQNNKSNKILLNELMVSHKIIELTLLSQAVVEGENDLLINHHLRMINPGVDDSSLYLFDTSFQYGISPNKDGRLRSISKSMKFNFIVSLEKSGIFLSKFTYNNEEFAKAFTDNHIRVLRKYYIEKRTAQARVVLDFSEENRNKVKEKLSTAEKNLASFQDRNMGLVMHQGLLQRMRLEREVAILNEMYQVAELSYQNASINVVKHTPYIQIVDDSRYPLFKTVNKPLKFGILGAVVGFLATTGILVGFTFLNVFLQKQKEEYETI